MNHDDTSMREKLILATIELIETEPVDSITIRNIATKANMNSAAINYYFRTKENLLTEALKATLNHAFMDMVEILERTDLKAQELLQTFFEYLLVGGIMHQGVTRAHLYEPFVHVNYSGVFFGWFNSVLEELLKKLQTLFPEQDEVDLKMSVTQILSTILFPIAFPNIYQHFGIDYTQPDIQKKHIHQLLQKYFGFDVVSEDLSLHLFDEKGVSQNGLEKPF